MKLLRERRNRAYSRLLFMEKELSGETEHEAAEALRRKIGKLKKIMMQASYEISRIPLCPTHNAIAEELGIPKGTVDTGLRWIKQKLSALYLDGSMEYSGYHETVSGVQQQT
jgi:DNA-directed RNA polymerase specialized sigma24 family protein